MLGHDSPSGMRSRAVTSTAARATRLPVTTSMESTLVGEDERRDLGAPLGHDEHHPGELDPPQIVVRERPPGVR